MSHWEPPQQQVPQWEPPQPVSLVGLQRPERVPQFA